MQSCLFTFQLFSYLHLSFHHFIAFFIFLSPFWKKIIEIIYELYIYNISISCIFFIGIGPHNKIEKNGDYIPQNRPIRLKYHLFFMRGIVLRNLRHNFDPFMHCIVCWFWWNYETGKISAIKVLLNNIPVRQNNTSGI